MPGFSSSGQGLGVAGEHMDTWCLFIADMCILLPDFMFLEITELAPEEFHREGAAAAGMDLVSGIDNPVYQGVPSLRPRRHSFAWNPKTIRFHGSFQEYKQLFDRATVLTADHYLLASEEERQAHMP